MNGSRRDDYLGAVVIVTYSCVDYVRSRLESLSGTAGRWQVTVVDNAPAVGRRRCDAHIRDPRHVHAGSGRCPQSAKSVGAAGPLAPSLAHDEVLGRATLVRVAVRLRRGPRASSGQAPRNRPRATNPDS